jgi:hypothetical protein
VGLFGLGLLGNYREKNPKPPKSAKVRLTTLRTILVGFADALRLARAEGTSSTDSLVGRSARLGQDRPQIAANLEVQTATSFSWSIRSLQLWGYLLAKGHSPAELNLLQ